MTSCLDCYKWKDCDKRNLGVLCSEFKHLTKRQKLLVPSKKLIIPTDKDTAAIDQDLEALCQSILDEKPLELKIDDRDIPTPPNFYQWCYRPEYLNLKESTPPFAWQLKMGLDLFQEVCPYCSDMKWWDDPPVDATVQQMREHIVLQVHGVCPKCKRTHVEMMDACKIDPYIILAACCGQRAGKSLIGSVIGGYQTAKFVKIDIAKEFGLMPSSQFQATFTALVYDQVHRNFYSPYLALLQDTPWFNSYFDMLKFYQQKHGEELFALGEKFVRFKHRKMTIMAKSPNVLFMRGFTSFMTAIDELGLFADEKANSKRFDGDGIYQTLSTSLLTLEGAWLSKIRNKGKHWLPKPISINVSSPYSSSDKIMRLVHDSKTSKRIYGIKKATWEVNPTLPEDSEYIRDRFREDPVKAARDLACIPPASANPFIEDDDFVLTKQICVLPQNHLKIDAMSGRTATGKKATVAKITGVKPSRHPSILAVDAGSNDNSFAIAVVQVNQGTVEYVVLQEVMPINKQHINYAQLYKEVLKPIMKDFNIRLFLTDRWQSLKFLHDIEQEYRINAEQYSVKYVDFTNFKDNLMAGNVKFPALEVKPEEVLLTADINYPECYRGKPIAHFIAQMLTVQDLGKKVIKGHKRTDDIFRAAVLAHRFAVLKDWHQKLSYRIDNRAATPTVFAATGSGNDIGAVGKYATRGSAGNRSTMLLTPTLGEFK